MVDSHTRPRSWYPPGFDDWQHEERVDYLTLLYSREGMIRLALHLARHGVRREVDSRSRLRKDELAAIVLALDPDRESPSHSNRYD